MIDQRMRTLLSLLILTAFTNSVFALDICSSEQRACDFIERASPGINIDQPLISLSDGRFAPRLAATDFDNICNVFHSIRLAIRWSPDQADFLQQLSAIKDLSNTIIRKGCLVVIDYHKFEAIETIDGQNESSIELFSSRWAAIASNFVQNENSIALELLNEPSSNVPGRYLNRLYAVALHRIRFIGFSGTILLGPRNWNTAESLRELTIPSDDNVGASVHTYSPMSFTHQGANWLKHSPPPGVTCCTDEQLQNLKKQIAVAGNWQSSTHHPVLFTEIGVIRYADPHSRAQYLKEISTVMREHSIGFQVWDYDKAFSIYNTAKQEWEPTLLDALSIKKQ